MIRAHVAEGWSVLGVGVSIVQTQGDGERPLAIMRTGSTPGTWSWEPLPDGPVAVEPTLTLGHEEARALLDALLRHYEGASDMHTVRADLLHERGRVDKLTQALMLIATTPAPVAG